MFTMGDVETLPTFDPKVGAYIRPLLGDTLTVYVTQITQHILQKNAHVKPKSGRV